LPRAQSLRAQPPSGAAWLIKVGRLTISFTGYKYFADERSNLLENVRRLEGAFY
jgi:hypothetical protein